MERASCVGCPPRVPPLPHLLRRHLRVQGKLLCPQRQVSPPIRSPTSNAASTIYIGGTGSLWPWRRWDGMVPCSVPATMSNTIIILRGGNASAESPKMQSRYNYIACRHFTHSSTISQLSGNQVRWTKLANGDHSPLTSLSQSSERT